MAKEFDPKRIAVVGAGAMGSLFGGLLCEGGLDVTLIDVWKEHIDKIRKDGLKMTGYGGDRMIKIKATLDSKEAGKMDVVIIQPKARHTPAAAQNAMPLLDFHTVVVSFQNGVGKEETIGGIVGMEHVIAGTTAQGANILEPGVVRNAGNLPTKIGELDGRLSERVRKIADTFTKAGLQTTASENIQLDIWKKLMANVAINPISGLCNFTVGEILDIPEVKEVIFEALDEAAKVANAAGVKLESNEAKEVLLQITGKEGTRTNRSGMLVDVLNERKTEIDVINGAIVRLGKKYGIPTPVNKTLVAAVKGLERNFT